MLKFLIGFTLLLLVSLNSFAQSGSVKTHTFISNQITTGLSTVASPLCGAKTIHAFGSTTAGVGAASITVLVSNDGTNFFVIDTLSLTLGTTVTSDTYESLYPYKFIRVNVASISGTNASVSAIMGCQL